MSPMLAVLIALVVTIVYGYKSRKNMAPMALFFAFLIGCAWLKLSTRELVAFLPVNTMLNVFSITFFFGFAIQNGTLTAIVNQTLYKVRRFSALVMPVLFILSFVMALLGAGIYASAFMAPLAFQVAKKIETKPILAYVATVCGTAAGSNFTSSAGGAVVIGMLRSTEYGNTALHITMVGFLWSVAISALSFAGCFLLFRGWACTGKMLLTVEPLNPVQKKTAVLIAVVTVLAIVPAAVNMLFSIPGYQRVEGLFDISFLMISGGCAASVLNLGDDKSVLCHAVPWNTITMLGGISVLLGVGNHAGMTDALVKIICENMHPALIAPLMAVVAGLMSMFSSAISVVIPTLYLIVPQLCTQMNLSAPLLYVCIFVAATMTGASPLSANGSMTLGSCYDEEQRGKLFYQVIPLPFFMLAAVVVLSCVIPVS